MLILLALTVSAEGAFSYRFADREEAAELLLGNRAYYENLSQNDLNYRMQKLDATLEELEAFTAEQTLDFTEAEKAAIDKAMQEVRISAGQGATNCRPRTASSLPRPPCRRSAARARTPTAPRSTWARGI